MESKKLTFTDNSPLKAWPWDAKTLYDRHLQCVWKQKGDVIEINDAFTWEGKTGDGDDHVCILTTGGDRFFAYAHHCRVEEEDPDNDPKDDEAEPEDKGIPLISRGKIMDIKGFGRVGTRDKISKHFRWGELTKGGSRIPQTPAIARRMVRLAEYMDAVRAHLGDKPISVTSQYRTPQVNRRVGGSSKSRHMYGDAIDFRVKGMDCVDVFNRLKSFHAKQGGLAVGNGFVHLDLRGFPARWRYPNGPKVDLW